MDELIAYAESLMAFIESRGASYNVETQRALGAFLQEVLQVISEQEQHPVEGLQPIQEPQLGAGIPSSNINSFGYDDENGRLLVKFQGDYPQENGPVYAYEGVPPEIFALFQKGAVPARTDGQNKWGRWYKGKVPSLGASLYTLIRTQGYPYQRLA